jgi:hypothetical protein
MVHRHSVLAAFLLLSGCAAKPEQSLMEEVALREVPEPRPKCQEGHGLALDEGIITIRPGEVLCITLRAEGDKVIPVAVTTTDDPNTTLIVRAWHEPGKPDTFMLLHNPLGAFLRYEATMFLPGRSQGEYTSSCPVLSRRMAFEHWPYQISSLKLGKFSLEPDSEQMWCR